MEHFINNLNIELKNQTDIFYAIALEAILDSMEYEYDSALLEYADDEIMQISLDGEELVLCYDFDSETGNIEFELLGQDEYEEEYGALEPDDLSDEDDTDEDDEDDGFLIYGVDVDKDGSMTMDGEYDYMDFTAYWNPEDESLMKIIRISRKRWTKSALRRFRIILTLWKSMLTMKKKTAESLMPEMSICSLLPAFIRRTAGSLSRKKAPVRISQLPSAKTQWTL